MTDSYPATYENIDESDSDSDTGLSITVPVVQREETADERHFREVKSLVIRQDWKLFEFLNRRTWLHHLKILMSTIGTEHEFDHDEALFCWSSFIMMHKLIQLNSGGFLRNMFTDMFVSCDGIFRDIYGSVIWFSAPIVDIAQRKKIMDTQLVYCFRVGVLWIEEGIVSFHRDSELRTALY